MLILSGMTTNALVARMDGYLFKKHLSKATAEEWAGKDNQTKGYFKKTVTMDIDSKQKYDALSPTKQARVQGLEGMNARKLGQHFKNREIGDTNKLTQNVALTTNESADLASKLVALSLNLNTYYQSDKPDTRFLLITGIPLPYVGRSIDPALAKTKGLANAVLLVSIEDKSKPLIFNMFPADNDYLRNKVLLVN